jgi:hypothetical protein
MSDRPGAPGAGRYAPRRGQIVHRRSRCRQPHLPWALLELILIIANLGTALVLIPLLKRQNEILTFSYVAARILECVFILVGILAVLAIVTL